MPAALSSAVSASRNRAHPARGDRGRHGQPAFGPHAFDERDSVARHRIARHPHSSAAPAKLTQLDQLAAELGHELGPIRLAFGEALNALERRLGYHELGFSSLSAYATEHAGKPKRWVAESRALATSLEHLTTLRRQLLSGRLPWTRAELLAKLVERSLAIHDIANPDAARALLPALELSWLFRSSGLTCRELSEHLRSLSDGARSVLSADNWRLLTLTVPTEDTWWFHAAARTFRRVAERKDLDAFFEALLAETQNTLCGESVTREDQRFDARERWRAQLDQWRTHAERLCERARDALVRPGRHAGRRHSSTWPASDELLTWSLPALNQHVIALARRLHINTVALGRCADQLHGVEAWRRLGFASPGHYARDRLGVSLSSLKQKRALARRLVVLPRLAHALEAGQLGSVAASLVARVATSKTEQRWVERARQRTVKHLREEVSFVERILRSRPGHPGWPPTPAVMRAELALRGSIVSGQPSSNPGPDAERNPPSAGRAHSRQQPYQKQIDEYAVGVSACCSPERPWHLPPSANEILLALAAVGPTAPNPSCSGSGSCPQATCTTCGPADPTLSPLNPLTAAGQISVYENPANSTALTPQQRTYQCTADPTCMVRARHPRLTGDGLGIGRVRLRLRVREYTLLLYREVARAFAREHPTRRLLRGLCEHFLTVWNPVVARRHEHKYEHIFERDAYTCTSPVCGRHDLTPHHLKFRSKGGGDEPENLTSLCVWCHLEGVHGGRIRAEPQPDGIHWTIGRLAPSRVVDRDRVATNATN